VCVNRCSQIFITGYGLCLSWALFIIDVTVTFDESHLTFTIKFIDMWYYRYLCVCKRTLGEDVRRQEGGREHES